MNLVVLIPIYQDPLSYVEQLTVKNNFKVLSKRFDVLFIGPSRLRHSLSELASKYRGSKIKIFSDNDFSSIHSYDLLLRSKRFYELFLEYDYIFIVQTDAVVFSDEVDEILNKRISYVGAPWYSKHDNKYVAVGNGGLSLRNVDHFLKCFEKIVFLKSPEWFIKDKGFWARLKYKYFFGFNNFLFLKKTHEDFYWSQLIPMRFSHFNVADIIMAKRLFLEVNYEKEISTAKKIPVGIHAWEKHGSPEAVEKIICFLRLKSLHGKKKALSEFF
jgi:hypothetical protein